MTEQLPRKRAARRGHRSSATRTVTQTRALLDAEGDKDLIKLRQKRQALQSKLDVLSTLDNEILELVEPEAMEEEILRADEVRDQLETILIELDQAIGRSRTPTPIPEPPEPLDGDEDSPLHSDGRSEEEGAGREESPRIDSPHVDPPHADPPHADSPHVDSPHVDSPHVDSHYTEPSCLAAARLTRPNVKLPKLSLKKFGGDMSKWTTFWDVFEAAIHSNPSLSPIDKFTYLKSVLDATAADAIAGLTLSAANYVEAISTLKRRFGNKQLIVNRHMEILLSLEAVPSPYNLKGLRHLYDSIELNVRGLKALGVSSSTYGGLLSSILINKLPPELRLIISRALGDKEWEFEAVMKVFERELLARERSADVATAPSATTSSTPRPRTGRHPPATATTLVNSSPTVTCVYCGQPHFSDLCERVKTPAGRKQILRDTGRCFICLRRRHVSRDCKSSIRCSRCSGRHHVSLCTSTSPPTNHSDASTQSLQSSTLYVEVRTPILLQTAKVIVRSNPSSTNFNEARAILDLGSQRSYVTASLRGALALRTLRSETIVIKTFGATQGVRTSCDIVQLSIDTKDGGSLTMSAVVVPHICDPLRAQPVEFARGCYDHLALLELADPGETTEDVTINILIGSDYYWSVATGQVRRGQNGPTAIETRLGWVLSGPVNGLPQERAASINVVNTCSTHLLKIETYCDEVSLDQSLQRFWELESLGIMKHEDTVKERFIQQIAFRQGRYEVGLPWKEFHPSLPDNYALSLKRLKGLLKRLGQSPDQLQRYDEVIKDQLEQGIVEVVPNPSSHHGQTHYLPHHSVIRQDKQTTKLRIVYDASARSGGPSLNDCLHTGPNFGQSILDLLLRLRIHPVVLVGDIEKAFLMISVAPQDRDVLRFLWVRNVSDQPPEITVFRFTRVVFGVSASPFLLNATIDYHLEQYAAADPQFVAKFRRSVYVDDVTSGFPDVQLAYEFYHKSKTRLAAANFNLRKFRTNSAELRQRIVRNEEETGGEMPNDETQSECLVLGTRWNMVTDELIFDLGDVCKHMSDASPTKRNVISLATRFFDPLGVLSPITVRFKLLFQLLCKAGVDWDEPLSGELLQKWNNLHRDLQLVQPIVTSRPCVGDIQNGSSVRLIGYCDASTEAYAAVVYIQSTDGFEPRVNFVCCKTRVAPLREISIPRLELLSALLLARLINTIHKALEPEIGLEEPLCYTDSLVTLYWIIGVTREWKQFVENRVTEIRSLVSVENWRHCPGVKNPADIPSRGASARELSECRQLWLHGPENPPPIEVDITPKPDDPPEECLTELKGRNKKADLSTASLLTNIDSELIKFERFSSLNRIVRAMAYVLRFVRCIRATTSPTTERELTTEELQAALIHLLRSAQQGLPLARNFELWSKQFGLYKDEAQILRCRGRLENSDLSEAAVHPIFLDKNHHLTRLIIEDCHKRVGHGGVKATLTELRTKYWIVQGRQKVRMIVYYCVVCRRYQSQPYSAPPPPPLPSFRVSEARPFSYTGVDFAGPIHIKSSAELSQRIWICLFTCCATRAAHLELVPDMTTQAFIRCFKRFTSRRGFPVKMISDNAQTFKAAARMILEIIESAEVRQHFTTVNVKWSFNLERAPWWGGIFERMIQTAKRCLRKTIGKARLTFDEFLTAVTEVEMVLNSRPVSYVSSEDLDEPLTPSHLLVGYRVLTIPGPSGDLNDPDYRDGNTSDLSRRLRHLNKTLNDFWSRWRSEYLMELREAHRYATHKGVTKEIAMGDMVIVFDDKLPRGLWKLGKVEELIIGGDTMVRGARVRVHLNKGKTTVIQRSVLKLYPLEVRAGVYDQGTRKNDVAMETTLPEQDPNQRPKRQATVRAKEKIRQWTDEVTESHEHG